MRETLFIYLPSGFEQQSADTLECNWAIQSSQGKYSTPATSYLSTLSIDAGVDTKRARIVTILPATSASLISASVPKPMLKGSASRWQRALPFSLEDQLADDVDKLHFAMPPKDAIDHQLPGDQASVPVATIRKSDLATLHALLLEAKLPSEHWTLETLLVPLPASGNGLGVVVHGDVALVRSGPMSGFSCPLSMLPLFAKRLAAEVNPVTSSTDDADSEGSPLPASAPLHIQCHALGLNADETSALRESLTADNHQVVINDGAASQITTLLAQQFSPRSVNLRQGDFAEDAAISQYVRPWKWVAAAATIVLAVEMGSGSIEIRRNNNIAQQARDDTSSVFRQAVPGVRRIQNPRVQMKQAIDAARGGDQGTDFIRLLADISPEIAALENVAVESINFRNDILELKLAAKTVATVDQFKARLDKLLEYRYDVISVNAGSDEVDVRINISQARSGATS